LGQRKTSGATEPDRWCSASRTNKQDGGCAHPQFDYISELGQVIDVLYPIQTPPQAAGALAAHPSPRLAAKVGAHGQAFKIILKMAAGHYGTHF